MQKNINQKLMAIIGSIIVLLTISGCSKKYKVNDLFLDSNITLDNEDKDLKEISRVYKDYYFSSMPIVESKHYDKKLLQETFSAYNIDIDFDAAYVFLNNYLNYLDVLYDDKKDAHLYDYISIEKPDEDSYDASYKFNSNMKSYVMNIYKKEYASNYYEIVSQSVHSSNLTFTKKYFYQFDKIPGDKNNKSDVAYWDINYDLLLIGKDHNEIKIVISDSSEISKKYNKFHTNNNVKNVKYFCNGILIKEEELNNNEFNNLVNNIYYIYINNYNLEELLNSKEEENKYILKLIKN